MNVISTYKVKIKERNESLKLTLLSYRKAVDFFVSVCLEMWSELSAFSHSNSQVMAIERATHSAKTHPNPKYNFDDADPFFSKFPSYLRRSAIKEAIGKVSSYKSNLKNWEEEKIGKKPSISKVTYAFPCLYNKNMYVRDDTYTASIKVYDGHDWIWQKVTLRKSDVDYIERHLKEAKECVPTLIKRGKCFFLSFSFVEEAHLKDKSIERALSVDLGINNACTCVLMTQDGTVCDRSFLKLSQEEDQLVRLLGRIKRAQIHGAKKMPHLWTYVNNQNRHISEKTAQFILSKAIEQRADVIVFEHLDLTKKVKGKSKRQRLHLWKAKKVLEIVTHRAHLMGIRVSTVSAVNTSKFAFDGSGIAKRGNQLDASIKKKHGDSYSLLEFLNGKIYNADLNAALNIGARYFIRNIEKSITATSWQQALAKVPNLAKRTTCTLSDLFSLNAVLAIC